MQEEVNFREEHIIIGSILAKYPLATEEEQLLLEAWKKKDGNNQIFDSIMESGQTDLQRIIVIIEGMEAVREKYLALIPQAAQKRMYWWNNWRTYAVAASIAIALITTVLWFSNKKNKVVATIVQKSLPVVQDATPGKVKAKLVLADGSVIVLDSAGNKTLTQQGSVTVATENGKLIYKSTGDKGETLYNTLSTAKGEMYPLILADGSTVWLNSQSSVHYPVAVPAGREINVSVTGEVFFDIVHNPKRQFRITVNGLSVDDIGTQFNVNAYTDEDNIKITLIEGSLKVKKGDQIKPLLKGQEAIAGKTQNDNTIKVIDGADLEGAIAWKNGQFKFNKDDLKTVMRQLSRWYDLDVVYQGNISKGEFIGTVPRNLKLSQVLEILASSDVHFKIEGKKLIVTP